MGTRRTINRTLFPCINSTLSLDSIPLVFLGRTYTPVFSQKISFLSAGVFSQLISPSAWRVSWGLDGVSTVLSQAVCAKLSFVLFT